MSASGESGSTGVKPDRLRTHAIELYCRELCGSGGMSAAAADVIRSISPADAGGGDDQLLRVTRAAAASHAPQRASPRGLRGVLAAEHESECDLTPSLLAERSNGELSPARQFKLENHLAGCLFCRAAEVREQRASRAFAAVLATGDPESRRLPEPAGPTSEPPEALAPVADSEPEPQPTTELPALADAPGPAPRDRRGLVVFPTGPAGAAIAPPRGRRTAARPSAVLAAYAPFLVTLALGAVVIVVVALALGGGSSGTPAAASLPPPAASSIPPASVGIAATGGTSRPAPAVKPNPQPAAPATPTTRTTP